MSINSEITRLSGAKTSLAEKMDEAGYSGLNNKTIDQLVDMLDLSSGGGGIVVTEEQDSHGGTIVHITGEELKLQSKSATPSETAQEITPDTGYTGLSKVNVGAISSTYVGSGITRNPTPTASGKTVTILAGYYSAQTTKDVATATQATPSISVSEAGLITASATQTAGYVSAGTKSATQQMTTQAAKTVTPTKSEQTAVAKGVFTTGVVKVAAIPSQYIVPSGGVTITENGTTDVTDKASVTVAIPFHHIYVGTGAPSASLGEDGDIYLQIGG